MIHKIKHFKSLLRQTPILSENEEDQARSNALKQWTEMIELRQGLQWKANEIELILKQEKEKTLCVCTLLRTNQKYQTVLLGVDFDNDNLLLDQLFPQINENSRDDCFELRFYDCSKTLALDIKFESALALNGKPAQIGKVINKRMLSDRRSNKRIYFDKSSAPMVSILIPMTPQITGKITNLSSHGIEIHFFGDHRPDVQMRQGDCKIHFFEGLNLDIKILVKQVSFMKTPCSRCLIRVLFLDTKTHQTDQLNQFIEAYDQENLPRIINQEH